jgi:hypothetical protein
LAEIDENLVRNELTELEQGVQLARRKQLYEQKYPETRHGGDRKSEESKRHNGDLISFTADTAAKTNQSRRSVERKTQIGEQLSDIADQLKETPIADSQKDLLALAQLPAEQQAPVVERILAPLYFVNFVLAAGTIQHIALGSHESRRSTASRRKIRAETTPAPWARYTSCTQPASW